MYISPKGVQGSPCRGLGVSPTYSPTFIYRYSTPLPLALLIQMLLEERQRPAPGVLARRRVVPAPLVVEERVPRPRINLYIVLHALPVQLGVQLARMGGREVVAGIRAHERAGPRHRRQGPGVDGVIRRHHAQPVVRAGPGDGQAPSHAKSYRPQPAVIHARLAGQKAKRSFQVTNAPVPQRLEQQAAHQAEDARYAVATREEIHGQRRVTLVRQPPRYVPDILVETRA